MADIVSKEVRSRMMSGIRGKNTKPELLIRQNLHRLGFRYSLHRANLPGKPDLVFAKHNAVIFVHGCFWHKHNCHLFKTPSTRKEFWETKLERTVVTDSKSIRALQEEHWRIALIWECALKGKYKKDVKEVIEKCKNWLLSNRLFLEITGNS